MFSEYVLLALYVTAVVAWAAITATMLRRRSSCTPTAGDHRDLHVYELARLAGGRARVMESLLVNLLEQGVIGRGPRGRRSGWHDAIPAIVACRDADPVGHALEQQLVDAVRKRPGERPIVVAYDAVACAAPELIEARLIADGLLFDDTRRRIVSGLGWSLFLLGAAWGAGKLIAEPAPRDLTVAIVLAATGMLVFFVALWAASGDRSVATRDGDGVVDRERAQCDPPLPARSPGDLALAVALFGMSALDRIDVLGAHGAEARHLQAYLDFESQQMI